MDRTANIARDLRALDRIVMALLVLAGLADDAAAASWPVRRAMLWLLRCAEARVKSFAGGYVFSMGLPQRLVLDAFDGDDPAAARSLALSLRVLASVIRDMIVRLRRRQFVFGRRPVAGSGPAPSPRHRKPFAGRIAVAPEATPDTS